LYTDLTPWELLGLLKTENQFEGYSQSIINRAYCNFRILLNLLYQQLVPAWIDYFEDFNDNDLYDFIVYIMYEKGPVVYNVLLQCPEKFKEFLNERPVYRFGESPLYKLGKLK